MLPAEESDLLHRAALWTGRDSDIAELARTNGLEFATAVLYQRIRRAPANAAFWDGAHRDMSAAKCPVDLIGIVPGAFHREHHHTGANGARVFEIARKLQCEAELIPLPSFGTLDANARIILDWLASRQNRRVALVSLSKGGADLKRALAHPTAETSFSGVAVWINISGIVQGTPLVEWLRRRPLRWWGVHLLLWWKGHKAEALKELGWQSPPVLPTWPVLPTHLSVIHVCGFPLRRHISHPWGKRAYDRLAPLGPNDGGGILLGDCLHLPGIVCPIWGADHYLAPQWDIMSPLVEIFTNAKPCFDASSIR